MTTTAPAAPIMPDVAIRLQAAREAAKNAEDVFLIIGRRHENGLQVTLSTVFPTRGRALDEADRLKPLTDEVQWFLCRIYADDGSPFVTPAI